MNAAIKRLCAAMVFCSVWSCVKHSNTAPADAGSLANPPVPTWALGYQATLFARALDVSCAPPNAQPGVEGCIALVRYSGTLDGVTVPQSAGDPYGMVAFIRTDAAGKITWAKTLMTGFDPISGMEGSYVDDDTRVQLLATGEFLLSGTYEGRALIGTPTGYANNEELGPSGDRNLMVIIFHPDGTFDDWEDAGNGLELRARAVTQLPNTQLVIAGSCEGNVPMDSGSFSCGTFPYSFGYLFTVNYDGSTVGGVSFGTAPLTGPQGSGGNPTRPAEASDIVSDSAGNVYVSGSFYTTMTYGANPPDLAAGEDDGFLMQILPDGTRAWITFAGGLGHDRGGRVARVPGGTLWTAKVALGGRVGATVYPQGAQVISKIDDTGAVVWTEAVPSAKCASPLGVAAADDGSFALYGDGFLGRYDATGKELWESLDAEVRGASFTGTSLVVAANVVGSNVLGASIAATADDVLRGAVVALPR